MDCPRCSHVAKKDGKGRKGDQRFKCTECGKRFSIAKEKLLSGMILSEDKALMCLNLLVEGNSVRATERITGVHRDTVLRLLETVGQKCLWIQQELVKNVAVGFVQADEIWSFVAMKDRAKIDQNIDVPYVGSAWTFTAIDAETKLIVAWHLGQRNEKDATIFMSKLRQAIVPDAEFQLSTDAFQAYKNVVKRTVGGQAHYGQIKKIYGTPNPAEIRYSPGECIGCKKKRINGSPIMAKVSTSYVERSNLTMRMSMRRFTRLTNGFSKKWDNLLYMLAIYFAYYNFCRSHKSLSDATPAMAANLTQTIWTLRDLLNIAKDIHTPVN